jgi:hypothetical protein
VVDPAAYVPDNARNMGFIKDWLLRYNDVLNCRTCIVKWDVKPHGTFHHGPSPYLGGIALRRFIMFMFWLGRFVAASLNGMVASRENTAEALTSLQLQQISKPRRPS